MRLASIDIGSNGARLLIKSFHQLSDGECVISRVMYMRIPLRLGADVFTLGNISKSREQMMKHMLKAFRQIMKLNFVDDYRALATSAMRDADNGKKLIKKLRKETDIDIEIIDGREEALLLCKNVIENPEYAKGNYAYIDVGGGSTEISLLRDGQLCHSCSYNIGTLRMLAGGVTQNTFDKMKQDLKRYADEIGEIKIIGSGGNINKLFKLSHGDKTNRTVTIEKIKDIYEKLKPLSVEERMESFGLKADRADVIVPAAEIFMAAAAALKCEEICVPNISLADSIVDELYQSKYASE